jgi:hypothetical protein
METRLLLAVYMQGLLFTNTVFLGSKSICVGSPVKREEVASKICTPVTDFGALAVSV